MKPILFSAILTAALGVAAGPVPVANSTSSSTVFPATSVTTTQDANAVPRLSDDERAALRAVELRDADLSEIRAGFAMDDDDTMLVLGTIGVVILIALLL